VKVYLARDYDGNRSLWDGEKSKPIKFQGAWCFNDCGPCDLLADDATISKVPTVKEMVGKGFYGVRKGQCKLLYLQVKEERA
jgi:hypothetical protein